MCALVACGGDERVTVIDGHAKQRIVQLVFQDLPPVDFVFVVDASAGSEAAALREAAARALDEELSELQRAGHGRWNPVDVRAWVVKLGERTVRSSADDPRLAWIEAEASGAGRRSFVDAVAAAWSPPTSAPDAFDALDTMRFALGQVPARRDATRLGVLVTSRDDPTAARIERFEYDEWSSALGASTAVTLFRGAACSAESGALERLGVAEAGISCHRPFWALRSVGDGACPFAISRDEDGAPACRVRAIRYAGAEDPSCDRRRGWVSPMAPDLPPRGTYEDDARSSTCDVVMLTGEDARRCRDLDDDCAGCASGWCVTDTPPERCAEPALRFVGGAASGATMEITCAVP